MTARYATPEHRTGNRTMRGGSPPAGIGPPLYTGQPLMDRRTFLRLTGAAAAAGFPAIVRGQASRPGTPCGVAAGDVGGGRAIVWSRTDRPARMFVEYATTERFADVRRVPGPIA